MKKTLLTLFFAFVLALSVASCNGGETPSDGPENGPAECVHEYSKMGYHASAHYKVCALCGEKDASTTEAHTLDLSGVCGCGCTFKVISYLDDGWREYRILFGDLVVKEGAVYLDGSEFYLLTTYDESGKIIKEEDIDTYGELFLMEHYEYNAAGKLTKRSAYYEEVLVGYYLYEYDAEGKLYKESDYDSDGTLDDYTVYIYDANGRVIREDDYHEDGELDEYHVLEYNAQGTLIKKSTYDEDGVLNDSYEYGEDGTLLKEIYDYPGEYYEYIEYNTLGAPLKSTYEDYESGTRQEDVYTRDKDSNLLTVTVQYFIDGVLDFTELHTYNDKGLLSRLDVDHPSSPEYNSYTVYTYDEKGKRIEQSTYQNGELHERVRFEYNDKGEETKQIFLDADGNVLFVQVNEYTDENTHVQTEYYGDMVSLKEIVIWSNETGYIILEKEYAKNGDVTYFYEGTPYGEGVIHQSEMDDGDCTTARHCTDCDFIFAPAREHVFENGYCQSCHKAAE